MILLKRLPGIVINNKNKIYPSIVFIAICVYLLFRWNVVCMNFQAWKHVNRACKLFDNGKAVGSLCTPLCQNRDIGGLTCHSFHSRKEAVFSGVWHQTRLVFKSAANADVQSLHWYDNGHVRYPSEPEFLWTTRAIVRQRLNVSVAHETLVRLAQLKPSYVERNVQRRRREMDNLWLLLQDNEYLLSAMYSERDIFPQLLGTCGPYFAVEYLDPLDETSRSLSFESSRDEWGRKLRTALLILEFLDELEAGFRDPFHLCEVKLEHFGVTSGAGVSAGMSKLKFIDLAGVYPQSALNNIFAEFAPCDADSDCEFYDCRSRCNSRTHRCGNVSNNNAQIVCEKLFVGWRMSNRVLVPGLLMTQHTPSELASLLRQCANPDGERADGSGGLAVGVRPRGAPDDEVRKRLYNVISEIEQVVNTNE